MHTITTSDGSIRIDGLTYGTEDIRYIADHSTGTLDIRNIAFGVRIFYAKATEIINGLTGLAFGNVDEAISYLVAGGIGYTLAGQGGTNLLDENGKIKPEYLSEINITSLFNSSQIAKVNGLLTIINADGAALPKPLPPINPIADDGANTFSWTDQGGLTALDTEKTTDKGSTVLINTVKPADVGDTAIDNGFFGVRYKATPDHQASDWLWSPIAFTASQGSDPDAGFTQVTTKGAASTSNVSLTGNRADFLFDSTKPDDFGYYVSPIKAPAGGAFTFRWTAANDVKSMWAGVSPGSQGDTDTGLMFPILSTVENNYGKLLAIIRANGNNNYIVMDNASYSIVPRMQVRGTGTRVYVEYSLDNGFTWTEFDPATVLAQPQVPLYIKGYAASNEAANLALKGMLQKGFA